MRSMCLLNTIENAGEGGLWRASSQNPEKSGLPAMDSPNDQDQTTGLLPGGAAGGLGWLG